MSDLAQRTKSVRLMRSTTRRVLRTLGVLGVLFTVPVFAWVPLGMLESVPSMIDVFGVAGLRIPASVVVGGLLMAAIGFFEW